MQIFLVTLMFVTQACTSCYNPTLSIPSDDGDDDETNDPIDTADEREETGDLPAPPLCEFEEVEPNNSTTEANAIDPEAWACGELIPDDADTLGIDFVSFPSPGEGWISLWARGESIGSAADIDMRVFVDDGDSVTSVTFERSPGTHEPLGWIPASADDEFTVSFSDAFRGAGPGYTWEFLASLEKGPPLDWNLTESEERDGARTNDRFADASLVLEDGDRVFAVMGNATSDTHDVYRIQAPEGNHLMTATLLAWEYGSPLNGWLRLYTPEVVDIEAEIAADPGTEAALSDARLASNRYISSETWDAMVEYRTSEAGEYYIQVSNAGAYFGPYHWYVLEVTFTEEAPTD
jgi:hypothetical protein